MPVTSLYFIPTSSPESSPVQDLIRRLNAAFEPTPLPPWALSHRLFRETPLTQTSQAPSNPDGTDKQKSHSQRFLQILSLSHHAPRTYVAITATQGFPQTRGGTQALSQQSGEAIASGEPATVISIPSGGSSEEFTQLIASKFGPLWQPRQVVHVTNGATFEVGDFKIRIGELKQSYGGSTQMTRGLICEVEWTDAEKTSSDDVVVGSGEMEWRNAEPIIKGFWDSLEVKGAREVFSVAGLGDEVSTLRQWCEILRLRSQ